MIHTNAKPLPTLPKLEVASIFNTTVTRINAMIGILFAAIEVARLAEARKTIDIQRLEQLGLFGNPDS